MALVFVIHVDGLIQFLSDLYWPSHCLYLYMGPVDILHDFLEIRRCLRCLCCQIFIGNTKLILIINASFKSIYLECVLGEVSERGLGQMHFALGLVVI